ncbi:MAG: hypothetical protein IJ555_02250 [Ruminococcus sp.]|nr:hypothetical protein [Ruminococcus sp.]MBR1752392.1 hypothetical protein [Ruminococcus sp.]
MYDNEDIQNTEITDEPADDTQNTEEEISQPQEQTEQAVSDDTEAESEEQVQVEEEEYEDISDEQDRLFELTQKLDEQLEKTQELSLKLDRLSSQVSNANKAIAVHEEIEKNLNNELQRYKNDFYDKLASPFLMQFIGLYIDLSDEMAEIREELENDPEKEHLKVQLDSLGYYADSVKGALINNGVEIKTPEAGSRYDYKEQRISKTIATEDESLRDCIAQARSSAFIYNGKVLRPAKVVVYKV